MSIVEDDYMAVDPEMARIWAEDEDPTFTEIRANMPDEEPVSEQPEDAIDQSEESVEETEVEVEEEVQAENSDETTQDAEDTDTATDEEVAQAVQNFKVKANGTEFDLSIDELLKLAPKGLDYHKKTQEIAPWRKTISALKDNGLNEQDVNLMIDVLKGNKDAIAEVLKRTQVDPLEVDIDKNAQFIPNTYGQDDTTLRIQEIVSAIHQDPEYQTTAHVVDDIWDNASRDIIRQNPDMIAGLHADVKDGTYNIIAPLAFKMKALDGRGLSDIEYYMEAGRQYFANQEATTAQQVQTQQVQQRQADIQNMATKRKAASPTKSTSGRRDVIDYLDENDEAFDEWYKNLQAKM